MQNLQEVWNRVQATKQQQKHIRQMYKDSLEASSEYKEITEKVKALASRKKQLEAEAKADLGAEYEKLNALKKEIQLDNELLSDIAVSQLMKGETVKITDTEENEYEPVFSVRFKKVLVVQPERK